MTENQVDSIVFESKALKSFDELPKRNRLLNPKQSQKVVYGMLRSSVIFIVLVLVLFLGFIIINGFKNFSFRTVFSSYNPTLDLDGLFPAILGTVLLALGAIVIAGPLGLLAAIYLTEYTKGGWIVSVIDQAINNLAGVPSIVIGLFGKAFFVLVLGIGDSMIAGWFTLACMLLPTIIRTSQEAIKTVPNDYREGSLALGVTKWRTIRHIVLPSALPGITTGVILAYGRAAGETAAVLYIGSGVYFGKMFNGFTGTFMNLPYMIVHLYLNGGGWNQAGPIMWQAIFILMLIVLSFNAIAIVIRNKSEKKRSGGN